MTNTYKTIILILLFQLTGIQLFSQNDSTYDISYYLDDGGIMEKKNIVKISLLSVIHGDLPVYYERIFGRSFGMEVGVGVLLPYYVPDIPEIFTGDPVVNNPNSGYSIWVKPKYYFRQKAPEYEYMGIQFRQRHFNEDIYEYVYTDISINYGLQLQLWRHLIFDYDSGIGFRTKRENTGNSDHKSTGIFIPINFKIGYIL